MRPISDEASRDGVAGMDWHGGCRRRAWYWVAGRLWRAVRIDFDVDLVAFDDIEWFSRLASTLTVLAYDLSGSFARSDAWRGARISNTAMQVIARESSGPQRGTQGA